MSKSARAPQVADKTEAETRRLTFDLSGRMTEGESIVSSAHTVPAGLTKVSESFDATAQRTQVLVSGGTAGTTYVISVLANTDAGQLVEVEGELLVE